jgi:hypothetical protein
MLNLLETQKADLATQRYSPFVLQALHWACSVGDVRSTKSIVASHPKLAFVESNLGDNPLHVAIQGDRVSDS